MQVHFSYAVRLTVTSLSISFVQLVEGQCDVYSLINVQLHLFISEALLFSHFMLLLLHKRLFICLNLAMTIIQWVWIKLLLVSYQLIQHHCGWRESSFETRTKSQRHTKKEKEKQTFSISTDEPLQYSHYNPTL